MKDILSDIKLIEKNFIIKLKQINNRVMFDDIHSNHNPI